MNWIWKIKSLPNKYIYRHLWLEYRNFVIQKKIIDSCIVKLTLLPMHVPSMVPAGQNSTYVIAFISNCRSVIYSLS